MTRIGVEQSLTDIHEALAELGYEVAELRHAEDADGVDFDFCVVTGLDRNVMGIQDAKKTDASIIDANGMTANEVVNEIRTRLDQ
jgi:Uncharacterised protein family (UPF0180)